MLSSTYTTFSWRRHIQKVEATFSVSFDKWTESCNYYAINIQNTSIPQTSPRALITSPSLLPQPLASVFSGMSYKWNHEYVFSFLDVVSFINIKHVNFTHFVAQIRHIVHFYYPIAFHYIGVSEFACPFPNWGTFRLFSVIRCYVNYFKHSCIGFCVNRGFISFE